MDVQRDQTGLIIPKAPYYELPAGLMVPLVKATDGAYKPLDSSQIRLPAPRPPSDRLLAVVEDFFAPPSADKPRDSEGWEKGALDEYYINKRNAIRSKESRKRRSPSPSPIQQKQSPSRSPARQRRQRSRHVKSLHPYN
jgi:calcium homeostasis ER protein